MEPFGLAVPGLGILLEYVKKRKLELLMFLPFPLSTPKCNTFSKR